VLSDARTLFHLLKPARGATGARQADRLETFYRGQAADYDAFRERLLPGREALVRSLPLTPGATWVDLGGGTAHNLQLAGEPLRALRAIYVVDLTPSLLAVAQRRVEQQSWSNVCLVRGDATSVPLPSGVADVVTCSYALTMIPDWRAAVAEAIRLLKPGGTFGSVDFYVSTQHSRVTQTLWPWWFAHSHVYLNEAHLVHLRQSFAQTDLHEGRTRLPYLPMSSVPWYRFTGTTRRPR
jgi:S-adenosylmethionine-diacylgycerolhomoserine-N-methlytransferase